MKSIRFIICILVIVFALSFISCGQSPTTTVAKTTTTIKATTQKVTQTTAASNVGLSESQRKQAFYDLAELQDKISADDPPDRGEQMLEAYSIIAKEYGITKDEMMKIVVEGMEKNWPFPPVK